MATPNLVNIATITPKNAMGSLSDTNRTTMIDVPAETAITRAIKIDQFLYLYLSKHPLPIKFRV